MTFDQIIIGILICVIIGLEILHQLQINRLINKLMSRNYYDYKISQAVDTEIKSETQTKIMSEEVEDFGHMSDYINNVT